MRVLYLMPQARVEKSLQKRQEAFQLFSDENPNAVALLTDEVREREEFLSNTSLSSCFIIIVMDCVESDVKERILCTVREHWTSVVVAGWTVLHNSIVMECV